MNTSWYASWPQPELKTLARTTSKTTWMIGSPRSSQSTLNSTKGEILLLFIDIENIFVNAFMLHGEGPSSKNCLSLHVQMPTKDYLSSCCHLDGRKRVPSLVMASPETECIIQRQSWRRVHEDRGNTMTTRWLVHKRHRDDLGDFDNDMCWFLIVLVCNWIERPALGVGSTIQINFGHHLINIIWQPR
jgi:hypothetical protein